MRRRGHSGKIDTNQRELVSALRRLGVAVVPVGAVAPGFPDLVLGFVGEAVLAEVKEPGDWFTPGQLSFYAGWPTRVYVLRSLDDVAHVARGCLDRLERWENGLHVGGPPAPKTRRISA